jgi:predicted Zn-dependent peptidase
MRFLDMAYMKTFFRNTYAPNNTVIAIVGDIQPTQVVSLVKRYFGRLPAQRLLSPPVTEEPVQAGERRVDVVFAADPKLIMGYHKPAPPAFADYVFDLIESLLTQGRTSRLYKVLVSEKRIAERIQAHNGLPGSRYPNQFVLFASPRHPHTALDVEREIDSEIERLKNVPASIEDLDKVKNQQRADFIRGLNSNAGLAGMLSHYEALLGDYRYLTRYMAMIDKISANDVQETAKTYLTRENRTVATLIRKP